MRINNNMMFRSSLADLNRIAEETATLLRQSGTGRRLHRASDDPEAALRAMRLRTDIAEQESLRQSIDLGLSDLTATELALDDATSVLQRARELGIQSATGTLSNQDRQAIGAELDQLLLNLVSIGNRKVQDRYLFGGTLTTTQPFTTTGDPPTAVTYNGNDGTRNIHPAAGVQFAVNIPGDEAFQTGTDVFDAMIQLRDAVLSGDTAALAGAVGQSVDDALSKVVNTRTAVGAIQAGLEQAAASLDSIKLQSQSDLSEAEDADLIDVLTQLQNLETRRTAMLQTTARVIQPTLMDYLA